jgi:cation:H+ antiporter
MVGLGLLVLGSRWLVDGASALARRIGITPFVIGATVVGFGTSAPELAVGVAAAAGGEPELSIGNVLGSNMFNLLAILGASALVAPSQ